MERSDTIKLVGVAISLAWIAGAAFVLLRRMGSWVSGTQVIREPAWYEVAIRHPTTYLALGAASVLVVIGWQIVRREVALGNLMCVDHRNSPWPFWSILVGEMSAAALLVHLAIHAVIAA